MKRLWRSYAPESLRYRLFLLRRASIRIPLLRNLRFGLPRRRSPIGRNFGSDRGTPVDRHYIETFLSDHRAEIRGRVLEIGDDRYTRKFGSTRVESSDVCHVDSDVPGVTVVADLADAPGIPDGSYDCVIITQTIHVIFDFRSTIRTLARILKPNGVVLATLPGISQISRHDYNHWGDFWRFTSLSARRIFAESFPGESVQVTTYGSVLTAASFLYGFVCEELSMRDLNRHDPDYEVIIGVCARKAS